MKKFMNTAETLLAEPARSPRPMPTSSLCTSPVFVTRAGSPRRQGRADLGRRFRA
jgi:hypothetical protein